MVSRNRGVEGRIAEPALPKYSTVLDLRFPAKWSGGEIALSRLRGSSAAEQRHRLNSGASERLGHTIVHVWAIASFCRFQADAATVEECESSLLRSMKMYV